MNRQITGRIATYHFAPTLLGKQNLMRENVNPDLIWVTGNTGDRCFASSSSKDEDR